MQQGTGAGPLLEGGGAGAAGHPARVGGGRARGLQVGGTQEGQPPPRHPAGDIPAVSTVGSAVLVRCRERSSSRGDLIKSGPGPGLTPPCIVRQATPVAPGQAGRQAAGPSFPPGRSQQGQRGAGLLWLVPTRLPGLVPHCCGGLSIPESPLWTRHSPAGLWGHNQAPEGVWQPVQAPPAPGRARGRGLRSPGNELTSVPSLLAGADPSSPGPPEAGSEQTPSAPREPGDLPGAPRLPEQFRKARGPAVTWVNTGSREV